MKLKLTPLLVITLLLFTSQSANAALTLLPASPKKGAAGGMGDMRRGKTFSLTDHKGATVTLLKPDLSKEALVIKNGKVTVGPTGLYGYHAIVAEARKGGSVFSIVRYEVFHRGKDSGISPSELIALEKTPLEITPEPLPWEHRRYMERKSYLFRLRFDGHAVPNVKMTLKTANGTTFEGITGADGFARMTFPKDFKNVKLGRRNNRPAEFTLMAATDKNGERYETTFSGIYVVNPSLHWQSGPIGFAMLAGGALLGGLVSWRNHKRNGGDAKR